MNRLNAIAILIIGIVWAIALAPRDGAVAQVEATQPEKITLRSSSGKSSITLSCEDDRPTILIKDHTGEVRIGVTEKGHQLSMSRGVNSISLALSDESAEFLLGDAEASTRIIKNELGAKVQVVTPKSVAMMSNEIPSGVATVSVYDAAPGKLPLDRTAALSLLPGKASAFYMIEKDGEKLTFMLRDDGTSRIDLPKSADKKE